jgi:hypothetical protein
VAPATESAEEARAAEVRRKTQVDLPSEAARRTAQAATSRAYSELTTKVALAVMDLMQANPTLTRAEADNIVAGGPLGLQFNQLAVLCGQIIGR